MIVFWAWPTVGAGHAARAAAICRHLRHEVVVVRGVDCPDRNRPLDFVNIPYVVIPNRAEAERWAIDKIGRVPPSAAYGNKLVLDGMPGTSLDPWVAVYIWQMNRPGKERKPSGAVMVRTEGAGSLWPVVMLTEKEILSRRQARKALGIPQDEFVVMGVPSTSRPGVVEAAEPDFMLTSKWWPALRYLRAADHVVGCIGANLYAEVKLLGLPVTWIKAPNAPDQAVRIRDQFDIDPNPHAAQDVAEIIDSLHP